MTEPLIEFENSKVQNKRKRKLKQQFTEMSLNMNRQAIYMSHPNIAWRKFFFNLALCGDNIYM